MNNNEIALSVQQNTSPSVFASLETFEYWQRVAKMLSTSNIVPSNYQNNIANTMVALELSTRMGVSPFMVMQNLDIIKGKPSWNSTFIIAVLNSCGRFEPLRFVFEGTPKTDSYGCRAVTKDKEGNELKSPLITWLMVKSEGWLDKPGSKWKTMPELMFQYRAASFFGRLYASDILKGMHSVEEVVEYTSRASDESLLDELQSLFMEKEDLLDEDSKVHINRIISNKETMSYKKAIKTLEQL